MTNNFVSEANATDLMNAINQKKDTKPDTITWSEWIALSDVEREGTHYIITNVPAQFSINDAIFSIKNRTLVFTNKSCTINDERITADTYVLTFYNDEAVAQAAGIDCTWTTGSITFTVVDNPVSDIVLDILFINPALSPGGGEGASSLSELSDVTIANPTNGQTIAYNSTTQKWENTDESGGGGAAANVSFDDSDCQSIQNVSNVQEAIEAVDIGLSTHTDAISSLVSTAAGKVEKSGDTMSGNLIVDKQDGTASAIGNSHIRLGNATAEGTAKNSRGVLRLYGKKSFYTEIYDNEGLTANRALYVPNKSGTIALSTDTLYQSFYAYNDTANATYTITVPDSWAVATIILKHSGGTNMWHGMWLDGELLPLNVEGTAFNVTLTNDKTLVISSTVRYYRLGILCNQPLTVTKS